MHMQARESKPVAPCSSCGTAQGARDHYGKPARYRGERYGLPGQLLCSVCRAREKRYLQSRSMGREPVVRKNRKGAGTAPPRVVVTPAQVAENIRAERERAESEGRRPRSGTSEAETRQREWSERAAAERRCVVESRR